MRRAEGLTWVVVTEPTIDAPPRPESLVRATTCSPPRRSGCSIWDELASFRSGGPADERPKSTCSTCSRTHRVNCRWATPRRTPWVTSLRVTGCSGVQRHAPDRLDAFGLPAENAAIERGADPNTWTYENIATQKASMRRYACSFDWDRVLNTCDPEFYRWNQWLFLRLFEKGLATGTVAGELVPE